MLISRIRLTSSKVVDRRCPCLVPFCYIDNVRALKQKKEEKKRRISEDIMESNGGKVEAVLLLL
jgi:hypothetical protein